MPYFGMIMSMCSCHVPWQPFCAKHHHTDTVETLDQHTLLKNGVKCPIFIKKLYAWTSILIPCFFLKFSTSNCSISFAEFLENSFYFSAVVVICSVYMLYCVHTAGMLIKYLPVDIRRGSSIIIFCAELVKLSDNGF